MGNIALRVTKKLSKKGNRASHATKPTEAKCYLHMLPPELRRCIFIQAAEDSFEVSASNRHIYLPHSYYDLGKLLDASVEETDGYINGLTRLETALLRDHKDLYFECLDARLSLSTLFLSPNHHLCPQKSVLYALVYPIFGKDIPYCLVESVRNVVYEDPIMWRCDHDRRLLFTDNLPCLNWHEKYFSTLKCSLQSLAIGLKMNDPAMERRFNLRIGNVWSYIADIDDEISRGLHYSSKLIKKIIQPRRQLALEQNKLLDDLCKELLGLELSLTRRYWRIYKKP